MRRVQLVRWRDETCPVSTGGVRRRTGARRTRLRPGVACAARTARRPATGRVTLAGRGGAATRGVAHGGVALARLALERLEVRLQLSLQHGHRARRRLARSRPAAAAQRVRRGRDYAAGRAHAPSPCLLSRALRALPHGREPLLSPLAPRGTGPRGIAAEVLQERSPHALCIPADRKPRPNRVSNGPDRPPQPLA